MSNRKTITALKARHIATKGRPLKTYKVRLSKSVGRNNLLGKIPLR